MARKRKPSKKSKKFYAQQTAQSKVKAEIITKYAASRATIITGSGATKVVHLDLWAGRGRYDDGAESTPLMVLRNATADAVVRKSLMTIFNDKDHADELRAAIGALPGINTLAYKPEVLDMAVGAGTPAILERVRPKIGQAPMLTFLDPWGYTGLTRDLIRSLLRDWGCEVMFFFNFNRVNMDITNEIVKPHIDALFGPERLTSLRAVVTELEGEARERAVTAALYEMVREVGGQFILPFRFVKDGEIRTSHYLIFVSKHFLGYKIMRDVMWKASSYRAEDGVASFECNSKSPLFIGDGRSLETLADMLVNDFAGTMMTVKQVFEQHSIGKLYVSRNYKNALILLEDRGRIGADPARRPSGTMADHVRITFPRAPLTGVKAPASRSTLDHRAFARQPSTAPRPTA
jgi:three-Cys-motif partner protein